MLFDRGRGTESAGGAGGAGGTRYIVKLALQVMNVSKERGYFRFSVFPFLGVSSDILSSYRL